MIKQFKLVSILFGLFSLAMAMADTDIVEQETQYLLDYIEHSGCVFIRNGSEYSPQKARSHIQRKYNYVKDKISTTEQVIQYAATESSWTGRPYTINCPNKTAVPSADWLTKALIDYRESQQ